MTNSLGGRAITAQDILNWDNLSATEQSLGIRRWLAQWQITQSAARFLSRYGISKAGYSLLKRLSQEPPKSITHDRKLVRLQMKPEQRIEMGGRLGNAVQQYRGVGTTTDTLTATGAKHSAAAIAKDKGRKITDGDIQLWKAMSQAQRESAGGPKVWAENRGKDPLSAVRVLSKTGITLAGEERISGRQRHSITKDEMQAWKAMTPAQRDAAGGSRRWSFDKGIALSSARWVLTDSGLTAFGEEKLAGQPSKAITNEQIKSWNDKTPEQKKQIGGWEPWAVSEKIRTASARKVLTDKGLRRAGKARLAATVSRAGASQSGSGNPTHFAQEALPNIAPLVSIPFTGILMLAGTPGENKQIRIAPRLSPEEAKEPAPAPAPIQTKVPETFETRLLKAQLQIWSMKSQEERNLAGGAKVWAPRVGIKASTAAVLLTDTGLSLRGQEKLSDVPRTAISAEQIAVWGAMTPQQRHAAGGARNWAFSEKIKLTSAEKAISDTGVNPIAATRHSGRPITQADLTVWQSLPPQQKFARGGWQPWSMSREINLHNAKPYLSDTGITEWGEEMLSTRPLHHITHDELRAWQAKTPEQIHAAGGWKRWSRDKDISLKSADRLLSDTGLTKLGKKRLSAREVPSTTTE